MPKTTVTLKNIVDPYGLLLVYGLDDVDLSLVAGCPTDNVCIVEEHGERHVQVRLGPCKPTGGLANFWALLGLVVDHSMVCDHSGWHFYPWEEKKEPEVMLYRTCESAAGYYQGYWCSNCGPYHRCWDHYYRDRRKCERDIREELSAYVHHFHPNAYMGAALCAICEEPTYDPVWHKCQGKTVMMCPECAKGVLL